MNPFRKYPAGKTAPSFLASQLNPLASVANLPSALTINGVSPQPSVRYKGGDASAGGLVPWVYGPTLALQAGTAPTYNTGSPLLGALDDSVLFNGGGYFLCADTTSGNVGTNDLVPHIIFRAVTTKVLFAKRNAAVGWEVGIDSSLRLYLTVQDASGATTTVSAALASGTVYDGQIFADRSGSCQIYVDGAESGSAVAISGRALTLDAAVALAVGADSGGASIYTSHGMLWELHQGASWLDSHLQPTVAAQRFSLVEGLIASLNRGVGTPTAARASVAYLQKTTAGVKRLWSVGANWVRGETEGTLISRAETNRCLQSIKTHTTPWVERGTGLTAENTAETTDPEGLNRAGKVTGIGATGVNDVYQLLSAFTANADVFPSFWIKRISTSGTLRLNSSVAGSWTIDMSALPDAWVKIDDASAYKAEVANWNAGATGGFYFQFNATAGAPLSFYLWNASCTLGPDIAGSDIVTTTAAVTRAADSLYYAAASNLGEGQGALLVDFYVPAAFTPTVNRYLISASIGASTADTVGIYVDTSGYVNGVSAITSGDAGAVQVATSVLAAAGSHRAVLSWQHNLLRLWVDGVKATDDTEVDIPASMTRINIGSDGVLATQAGPIRIVRWKAYPTAISSYNKAG